MNITLKNILFAGVITFAVVPYYLFENNDNSLKRCPFESKIEPEIQQTNPDSIVFITVGSLTIEMVYVKGGTYTMGCTDEQDDDCWEAESPVHSVTLDDFYIGKYEVTQGLWQEVMGANPSRFKGNDSLPVENVNWDDCKKFIQKLNKMTGKNFRMPTEAEWEYAARGGKKTKKTKYSGSDNIDKVAWYWNNDTVITHKVGTKHPNELGIYDMSGNVKEWCSDWFGKYKNYSQVNPVGPSSGSERIVRGGDCAAKAGYSRVSCRIGYEPYTRINRLGLRLVLPR
ncbi:MAG: formylglycine-generating enzyme family protein [Bacteroidales bacterium]|nr:formylglycine-generating enzyme family protein [Bacteroidales bacterium]